MKIPNFLGTKVVDETGRLTPEWSQAFSQLFNEMQINLSDEGYVLPQQSTTNINALTADQSIGAMLYDSDTDEMKVNIDGDWKVVQVA